MYCNMIRENIIRRKWKTIAINRENDQNMFHPLLAPRLVFSGPLHSKKTIKMAGEDQIHI